MERFDWDDLRFFLAVARSGRLTAAARDGDLLRAAANPRGMQGYAAGR